MTVPKFSLQQQRLAAKIIGSLMTRISQTQGEGTPVAAGDAGVPSVQGQGI
jgi:hypothetical protein